MRTRDPLKQQLDGLFAAYQAMRAEPTVETMKAVVLKARTIEAMGYEPIILKDHQAIQVVKKEPKCPPVSS